MSILNRIIHRLVELNQNLPINPNEVPIVLSRARICKQGNLLKEFYRNTDMIFNINEEGKTYIIAKGLNFERIIGMNNSEYKPK